MTSVFLNYVNEGAQYLGGRHQDGVAGSRHPRSDAEADLNANADTNDMLALHLHLTRQLTRNKNKDYNRKSLWVVTFFTIVRKCCSHSQSTNYISGLNSDSSYTFTICDSKLHKI